MKLRVKTKLNWTKFQSVLIYNFMGYHSLMVGINVIIQLFTLPNKIVTIWNNET